MKLTRFQKRLLLDTRDESLHYDPYKNKTTFDGRISIKKIYERYWGVKGIRPNKLRVKMSRALRPLWDNYLIIQSYGGSFYAITDKGNEIVNQLLSMEKTRLI